jgi:hypothetical protein
MHRTLKFETTRPPRTNLLQQQERFDEFLDEFNKVRPHEAIGMKRPAQLYKLSPRKLPTDLPDPDYPAHDDVVNVHRCGSLFFRKRKVFLSAALASQPVGLREERDGRWLVTFMNLDLGHLDSAGFIAL